MKAIHSGITFSTVFIIAFFSVISPNVGYSQDEKVFFSADGDTALLFYESFSADTKLWTGRFNLYGGTGMLETIGESEEITSFDRIKITDRFMAIQSKHHLMSEGQSIKRESIPNLSVEFEAKKKKKIGLPEGLYTRNYQASYTISLDGFTIIQNKSDRYLIGKEDRVEEVIESDILAISCWKHPTSPRYLSTYTATTQKIIIPMYRYSYVEKYILDYVVYSF